MAKTKITIDLDRVVIGDLELIDRASQDIHGISMAALVDFLDRVVKEDVRQMPLTNLRDIMTALNTEIRALAEPEDDEGKN